MRYGALAVIVVGLGLLGWLTLRDEPSLDGEPVGDQLEVDLIPGLPKDVRTTPVDGRDLLRFTSTLINAGSGQFVLRGTRAGDDWSVEQILPYSAGGSVADPVDIDMVWGGDGHEHWHVDRIAVHWLQALDDEGKPSESIGKLPDAKVGFCFFDSHVRLADAADGPQFLSEGCGGEDSASFEMGLTRGWSDVYDFSLPGQSVDVTDLPDGLYRLYAEADQRGWVREVTRDNNVTWVDIDLTTIDDGRRVARVVADGPTYGLEFVEP